MLDVEWKRYNEEGTVLIIGKVKHSYAASKAPLQPWVVVKHSGTVLVGHCTCMAGLAKTCSHVSIGALLHWIEAAIRIQDSTSCTSKEKQWIMPKSMKVVSFLQLSEIDFSAPKRQKLSSTTNENPTSSSVAKLHHHLKIKYKDFSMNSLRKNVNQLYFL